MMMWRWTKGVRMVVVVGIILVAGITPAWAGESNTLTDQERQEGFELLFSGKDLTGWRQSGNWVIQEEALYRNERGGSLVYEAKKVPDDFELRFEWKVAEGCNSGVYYRPTQNEFQILDNAKHADGKNPRTSAASVYFCMAPSEDATKPVGQWNEARVVCKGSVVQHWLNGKKVIDFDYKDPKWAKEVELLRLRGGDLTARGAYLSFQDHNDPVWYRSIKMRALPESFEMDRAPIVPQAIPEEALKHEQEILRSIQERRAQPKKKAAAKGKNAAVKAGG